MGGFGAAYDDGWDQGRRVTLTRALEIVTKMRDELDARFKAEGSTWPESQWENLCGYGEALDDVIAELEKDPNHV